MSGREEFVTAGRTITEADLVTFSSVTGDFHPQHTDAVWAGKGHFGERIAHGMLILSYAVGLAPIDPERVVSLRGLDAVTFKRPVRIGDTIRVEGRLEESRPMATGMERATYRWKIVNQDDETVAVARVIAMVRSEPAAPVAVDDAAAATPVPAPAAAAEATADDVLEEVYL